MLVKGAFERAKNYIDLHSAETKIKQTDTVTGPCITISRETGAGAERVSEFIVENFSEFNSGNNHPWAIFDQNLIEKVLQDNNLPQRLSEIMEERKYSAVQSIMGELISGQPGTWTLFHKTTETILQLAHIGHSILVERGGNIITSKMDNCFHIRLIGSQSDRVNHVKEYYNFDKKKALNFINKEDENRKEYISTYFHKNIEDPQLYHIVINTSELGYRETAELISRTIMNKYPEYFRQDQADKLN